uniref:Uncharacterized protein n=1 Tax=Molossus molossus TaxID=27622 RepID=A0A7J8HHS2_MOLMO|nr:hypothetical protein HJG59_010999 [Molossus molossus]
MGNDYSNPAFWLGVTGKISLLSLACETTELVWVDHWPLKGEKLLQANKLVKQQLEAGHIEPSVNPWNTLIFVIPKKDGKWRLLYDLKAINAIIESMGALQPGLPNPQQFKEEPLNIVNDSQYVVKVLQKIEQGFIRHLANQHLLTLFLSLQALIDQQNHSIFITHI